MRSQTRRLRTIVAAAGLLLASAAQPAFTQTVEKLKGTGGISEIKPLSAYYTNEYLQ